MGELGISLYGKEKPRFYAVFSDTCSCCRSGKHDECTGRCFCARVEHVNSNLRDSGARIYEFGLDAKSVADAWVEARETQLSVSVGVLVSVRYGGPRA